jgi:hypothetical protein
MAARTVAPDRAIEPVPIGMSSHVALPELLASNGACRGSSGATRATSDTDPLRLSRQRESRNAGFTDTTCPPAVRGSRTSGVGCRSLTGARSAATAFLHAGGWTPATARTLVASAPTDRGRAVPGRRSRGGIRRCRWAEARQRSRPIVWIGGASPASGQPRSRALRRRCRSPSTIASSMRP